VEGRRTQGDRKHTGWRGRQRGGEGDGEAGEEDQNGAQDGEAAGEEVREAHRMDQRRDREVHRKKRRGRGCVHGNKAGGEGQAAVPAGFGGRSRGLVRPNPSREAHGARSPWRVAGRIGENRGAGTVRGRSRAQIGGKK
jgi:hypothetical protein